MGKALWRPLQPSVSETDCTQCSPKGGLKSVNSVLVESGGSDGDFYLQTLFDYIHLNPVRAGLVPSGACEGLLDYPWSSLAKGYALAPKARKPWLAVEDGFALFGYNDRAADRRRFVQRLEERMSEEARERCGLSELEGQTLRSTLRKGWYWGGESFKESLLDRLYRLKEGRLPGAKDFRSSDQAKDHAMRDARCGGNRSGGGAAIRVGRCRGR